MRPSRALTASLLTLSTVIAVAGCSSSVQTKDGATTAAGEGCLVVGTAGLNDHGFNASSWSGMQQAEESTGIRATYLETQDQAQYATNLNSFASSDCELIVSVGFEATDATVEAAKQHPDQKFAIVDVPVDPPLDNLRSISFDTGQAAFLAGYLAAGVSKTKKVAAFGAMAIPAIQLFLDGFARGVQYFNEQHNDHVEVLGWSIDKGDGVYTGSFTDQEKAKQTAAGFIQQGADVIFAPVSSSKTGVYAAIKEAGDVLAINGDVDGCDAYPQYCSLMLTSILKHLDKPIVETLEKVEADDFEGGNYVGNLENGAVGLGEFHDNASRVSPELAQEVEDLESKIASGEVQVDSPFEPK